MFLWRWGSLTLEVKTGANGVSLPRSARPLKSRLRIAGRSSVSATAWRTRQSLNGAASVSIGTSRCVAPCADTICTFGLLKRARPVETWISLMRSIWFPSSAETTAASSEKYFRSTPSNAGFPPHQPSNDWYVAPTPGV